MKGKLRSRSVAAIGLVALLAVSGGAIAAAGATSNGAASDATTAKKKKKKPISYEDTDLFFEINGTDGDAGLHMEMGGDAWSRLKIADPKGRRILDVRARSKLGSHGLASLMLESSEPGFDELSFARFKKRFPEGRYRFRGRTTRGRAMKGSDRLSHRVPKEPVVTFPVDGGTVDPDGFVFSWKPATDTKVEVDRYQLTVSNDDDPNGEVIIEVGPEVTSATIPGEYLTPGKLYTSELIAREKSGNRTISGLSFMTAD